MESRRRFLHPDLVPQRRVALLWSGVRRFGAGEYFAAHEELEEVWRSSTPAPRDLLQALIQVAAALHNALVLRRPGGAARTLAKARGRLASRLPIELGLDLATLAADLETWQRWLDAGAVAPAPEAPRLLVLQPDALR